MAEVEGAVGLSFDKAFLASVDCDGVGAADFCSVDGFVGEPDAKALPPATGFRLANGGRFGSVDVSLGLVNAEAMAPTLPAVGTTISTKTFAKGLVHVLCIVNKTLQI